MESASAVSLRPAAFWRNVQRGAQMCLPVAISIAAYGVVWGVLARQAGLSYLEALLMSGLVFAGSSQFVMLEQWGDAASLPIAAIVLAALIVNLRYVLLTAALKPLFIGWPMLKAAPLMFFVTDENWAMTQAEMAKGRGSVGFLLGGGLLAYFTWLISTSAGRLLGSAIDDPARYGLDFVFTATFLALLFGMWRGKGDILPWGVAAVSAIIAAKFIPGSWYIIIGGIAGSLAGATAETRKGAEP